MEVSDVKTVPVLLAVLWIVATPSHAAFTCGGPFLDAQRDGFAALFSPAYSPSLSHIGGAVAPANMSKKLTASQLQALAVDKPRVAATKTLTAANATWLKGTLNDLAQAEVPGWLSTVVGLATGPLTGLLADTTVQLVNASGSAGRLKLSNLAGTVSAGGSVAVLERVAKDAAGKQQFLWLLTYTAVLNGNETTALLAACRADVVPS
jgi:hypothetical protein